jgi:hypothetical protein
MGLRESKHDDFALGYAEFRELDHHLLYYFFALANSHLNLANA